MIIEREIWKPVKGYEGIYEVSTLGNVRTVERQARHRYGMRTVRSKILSPGLSRKEGGYQLIGLSFNGKVKTKTIHRLVAEAFLINPRSLPQVNHIDNNPLNNCVLNLEWVSARENNCYKSKRLKKTSKYIGVYQRKRDKFWVSTIHFNNKIKVLGAFKSEDEAFEARINFEKENKIINKYLYDKSV